MPSSSSSDLHSGRSRRSFLRLAGLAAAVPLLSETQLAHAALLEPQAATPLHTIPKSSHRHGGRASKLAGAIPADAVFINANENPMGPSPAAIAAIAAAAAKGGRYDPANYVDTLTDLVAKQNGISPESVAIYAGSTEPLHFSVLAFTSPTRPYVMADPGYEAGATAALDSGAKVIRTALTKDYAHDVKAMVNASPDTGLIYICNPNNPTGSLTSRADILWALENKPAGSVLLVDEAYIHLSKAESVVDQVAAGKDIIILRTFSKVYGMAGIRAGLALGRPDLLDMLARNGGNMLPTTALAAAIASLSDPELVPRRRKAIADTRNATLNWLDNNGFKYIPSDSNCVMVETGRPSREVIMALQAEKVYIGRPWPILPTHVRITVGLPEEMEKFQTAFAKVMGKTPVMTS